MKRPFWQMSFGKSFFIGFLIALFFAAIIVGFFFCIYMLLWGL